MRNKNIERIPDDYQSRCRRTLLHELRERLRSGDQCYSIPARGDCMATRPNEL